MAQLSPDQAEPLLLHHDWGFSFEEIAGMLGISPAAARARASRGMADLRVALNSFQSAQGERREPVVRESNDGPQGERRESVVRRLLRRARA
jgi:hypothetical protein